MAALLLIVPVAIISGRAGWPSLLQFVLTVASIVPLAAFIGVATEELAGRLGGKIGGLLNATFGNAPDLLVGVFGLQKGLVPLVKATLVGALISNSALVMGLCLVVAGLIHRRPRFDRREAGHHGVLMMLTVAAVLFPTISSFVVCGRGGCRSSSSTDELEAVSVAIAVILLLAYCAYVVFGIFGWEGKGRAESEASETRSVTRAAEAAQRTRWPAWVSVVVLGGATAALVPITDTLTGSVTPVTGVLGWTEVFVGMIIVANAGNAAEAYAAIRLAARRRGSPVPGEPSGLDLSLAIASASSVQIAAFVMPLVVLYSLFVHPMSLIFSGVEVAVLALLAILFAMICNDGESNWLEGAQLLALYGMAAVLFYELPVSAFNG